MGKSHTCYKISVSKKHMMDKPDHTHTKGTARVSRDIYNNKLKNLQTND